MKANIKILGIIVFVYMFASCSKSDQILPQLDDEGFKKSEPKTVTLPFKASFIGTYMYVGPNEKCSDPFVAQVVVDFVGTGTHLGRFTGNFDFCVTADSHYGPSDSYMVAANGDILYVSIQGQVIQGREDDHPEYVTSYWRDPFVILGGTGRFEGATGEGMSDDYNSSEDPNSHHNWTGTITLVKGQGH